MHVFMYVCESIPLQCCRLVQQCDTRIAAAAAGLDLRPLLTAEIQVCLRV
jgi:hypothetical protein